MLRTTFFSLPSPRRVLGLIMLVLFMSGVPSYAYAGDHDKNRDRGRNPDRGWSSCKREQDCAREALLKGEIRPLTEVLKAVREKVPGDIIEIELDREDGMWVYEVKVLPPSGRRKKLEIDARTLDIMKID